MSQAKLKVVNNENSMDKENRTKSLEAAVSLIEKNYIFQYFKLFLLKEQK